MKDQEKVWDEIAPLWSKYKEEGSLYIQDYLKDLKVNNAKSEFKILDLGCGSGRNLIKLKNKATFYCVDFSQKMLNLAEEKAKKNKINVQLVKANVWKLPFEDNFFDAGIYVSTIHCIENKEKRIKSLKEFYRALKSGKTAMVSAWDKNARRFQKKQKENLIPWTISFEKNGERNKVWRYYYLYGAEELKKELESVGFKIIKRIAEGTSNIVFVVGK